MLGIRKTSNKELPFETVTQVEEKSNFWDLIVAHFKDNDLAFWAHDIVRGVEDFFSEHERHKDFHVSQEDVVGYEEFADRFIGARDPEELSQLKEIADDILLSRKVKSEHGFWANLGANILGDPVSLVSGAVGGGVVNAAWKAARLSTRMGCVANAVTKAAASGGAASAVDVGIRSIGHEQNPRDYAIGVTSGMVLGGLIGAAPQILEALPTPQKIRLKKACAEMAKSFNADEDLFAQTYRIEDAKIAPAFGFNKPPQFLNFFTSPDIQMANSPFETTRHISGNIVPYAFKVVDPEGKPIAQPHPLESIVGVEKQLLKNEFNEKVQSFFKDYLKGNPKYNWVQTKMTEWKTTNLWGGKAWDEFVEEFFNRLNSTEPSPNPAIENAVHFFNERTESLSQKAIDVGVYDLKGKALFEAGEKVKEAETKLRIFNKDWERYYNNTSKEVGALNEKINVRETKLEDLEVEKVKVLTEKSSEYVETLNDLNKQLEENDAALAESIQQLKSNALEEMFDVYKSKRDALADVAKQKDEALLALSEDQKDLQFTAEKNIENTQYEFRELQAEIKDKIKVLKKEMRDSKHFEGKEYSRWEEKTKALENEIFKEKQILKNAQRGYEKNKAAQKKSVKEGLKKTEKHVQYIRESYRKNVADFKKIYEDHIGILEKEYETAKTRVTDEYNRRVKALKKIADHATKNQEKIAIHFKTSQEKLINDLTELNKKKDIALKAYDKQAAKAEIARSYLYETLHRLQEEYSAVEAKRFTPADFEKIKDPHYFPRVYIPGKIEKDASKFMDALDQAYRADGVSKSPESLEKTRETILHLAKGGGRDSVDHRRNELARTVDIPSIDIADFLVKDPTLLYNRFVDLLVPDIHLKKRFGTMDSQDMVDRLSREHMDRVHAAQGNDKQIRKLDKAYKEDVENIRCIWDRLRGDKRYPSNAAINIAMNLNNARNLGNLTTAPLYDAFTITMHAGMRNFLKTTCKYIRAKKLFSKETADTFVHAVDASLISHLVDLNEGLASGVGEHISQKLSKGLIWATRGQKVDETTKLIVGYMTEERVLKTCRKLAERKPVKKDEIEFLRKVGISENDEGMIASQFEKYGTAEKGKLWHANVEQWEDESAREALYSAVRSMQMNCVVNPTIGTDPKIFDHPMAKAIFQFKRCMFSAYSKALLPFMQHARDKELGTLIPTLSIGWAAAYLREDAKDFIKGQDRPFDEKLTEAFWNLDLIAYGSYFKDTVDKITNATNSYTGAYQMLEHLGGATVGLGIDLYKGGSGVYHILANDKLNYAELHAIRRLIPFNNLLWWHQGFNKLEQWYGEKKGIKRFMKKPESMPKKKPKSQPFFSKLP